MSVSQGAIHNYNYYNYLIIRHSSVVGHSSKHQANWVFLSTSVIMLQTLAIEEERMIKK